MEKKLSGLGREGFSFRIKLRFPSFCQCQPGNFSVVFFLLRISLGWSSLDEKFSRKLISIVTSPEFFFCLLAFLPSRHSAPIILEMEMRKRGLSRERWARNIVVILFSSFLSTLCIFLSSFFRVKSNGILLLLPMAPKARRGRSQSLSRE